MFDRVLNKPLSKIWKTEFYSVWWLSPQQWADSQKKQRKCVLFRFSAPKILCKITIMLKWNHSFRYVLIYICNHENHVPSRLLPKWLCSYSCTWAHYVKCAQVHELRQSHCGDNLDGTWFLWLHIYYAHLALVRFEHCVSWIIYDHLIIHINRLFVLNVKAYVIWVIWDSIFHLEDKKFRAHTSELYA